MNKKYILILTLVIVLAFLGIGICSYLRSKNTDITQGALPRIPAEINFKNTTYIPASGKIIITNVESQIGLTDDGRKVFKISNVSETKSIAVLLTNDEKPIYVKYVIFKPRNH